MLLPLVVIILLHGGRDAPEANAIERAIHVVVPAVRVEVVGDRNVLAQPDTDTVYVTIEWSEHHERADVEWRFEQESTHRVVEFSRDELPGERGRTLGFVIAALLPQSETSETPVSTDSSHASESDRPPHDAVTGAQTQVPAERADSLGVTGPRSLRDETSALRGILELGFQASTGLVDENGAVDYGGEAALLLPLLKRLHLRLAFDVRAGSLSNAQATTLWTGGTIGLDWLLVPEFFDSFGWALRASVGGGRYGVTHFSSDDPEPVGADVWMLTARFSSVLEYRATGALGLFVDLGGEVDSTAVDVWVRDELETTLNPFRIVGNLGMRVAF